MASNKGKPNRRREILRNLPKAPKDWPRWAGRRDLVRAVALIVLFAAVGSLIAMSAQRRPRYQLSQVAPENLTARVRFLAIDQQKTQERKADARDREPAVYVPNVQYLREVRERLAGLVELGTKATVEQIPAKERELLELTPQGLAELTRFHAAPGEWRQLIDQFMEGFAGIAVLEAHRARIERDPGERAARIVIQHPTLARRELVRFDNVIISIDDDLTALRESITALVFHKFPRDLRQTVTAVVMQNPRPIYNFDEPQTRQRRQARFDNDNNTVRMIYEPGDLLIPAGQPIKQLDLEVLAQERVQYSAQLGPWLIWIGRGAWLGLFTLLGVALWGYTQAYNPTVRGNLRHGLMITALLLVTQAFAVLAASLAPMYIGAGVVFPALLTAIVLAIAYDQRYALAIGAIHTLILLVTLGLPVTFGIVLATGVAVAVSRLHDVRNRSTIVKAGLWTALAMGGCTLLIEMLHSPLHLEGQIGRVLFNTGLVATTAVFTGLIVQGVLPAIERLFSVTTSMTLRELNDASHPLLRRLVELAPGTYQHSLRIADMAESAADTIDADGLLCRVGAMYHDIGKINKPLYFVENQGGGPNRHNKLSPAMSLLIIVGHVKDGIEMAREFNLPRVLRHFIESHHGTTLVEYFFHAAKKQHDAERQPAPDEFEFRYPGPKPHTKEAAILMLCDCIEGAARTLDEPTAGRIEQLVHTMANKRLMDGQFDESDLTLQELHKIELSITKTLCAIYHGRVKYPSGGAQPAQAADDSDNRPALPASTAS